MKFALETDDWNRVGIKHSICLEVRYVLKKILIVMGTRPEAIKLCPLINELKTHEQFQVIVCSSGQHRELLDQVLRIFQVIFYFNVKTLLADTAMLCTASFQWVKTERSYLKSY